MEINQGTFEGITSLNNLTGDVNLVAGSNVTIITLGQNITIVSDAVGLISAGTNITLTGAGTAGNPYVINSSGGGVSIGGTITGGTANSILFVNPNAVIAQDNANFTFNPTTLTQQIGSVTTGGQAIIKLNGGILSGGANTDNFLSIVGTLPAVTTAAVRSINIAITTAGSSASTQRGLVLALIAGYTGAGVTAALSITNSAAGTGTGAWTQGSSNTGGNFITSGTGAGNNVGGSYTAQNSSSLNLGVLGLSVSATNSPALNVGVGALALNATVNVGGFFGLGSAAPTLGTSSALIADNGSIAADIFEARDNGTVVVSIADGGNLNSTISTTTPILKPSADSTSAINITKADGTTSIVTIDSTNKRVGIGIATPQNTLDVALNMSINNDFPKIFFRSLAGVLSSSLTANAGSGAIVYGAPGGFGVAEFSDGSGNLVLNVRGDGLVGIGYPGINSIAQLAVSGRYSNNPVIIARGASGQSVDLMQWQKSDATVYSSMSSVGLMNKYNSISTVSNGIPSELATVDLTAQSAAITATTIYTPAASGMFRISVILHVTTAATTSSILGGTTGVVLNYTEPDGSVAQTAFTVAMDDQTGAVVVTANGNITNTTQATSQGTAIIYAKTGVAIQYAIGYTSVGLTAMVFSAHLKLEAL